MTNIAVLGLREWHVYALRELAASGFRIVGVDPDPGAAGKTESNVFIECSLYERDRLKALLSRQSVDGVITFAEHGVATRDYLRYELGLPGAGSIDSRYVTDKYHMRNMARSRGIPVPGYFAFRDRRELYAHRPGFPFVVKPRRNCGGRGVSLVENQRQLERALVEANPHSLDQGFIAEEFLDGEEYSIELFTDSAGERVVAVGKRNLVPTPFFVPITINYAVEKPEEFRILMRGFVDKLVDAFDLRFGYAHIEAIYRNGELYLIEVARRGGGVFIYSRLFPYMTNEDLLEGYARMACGERFLIGRRKANRYAQISMQFSDYSRFEQVVDKKLLDVLEDIQYFRGQKRERRGEIKSSDNFCGAVMLFDDKPDIISEIDRQYREALSSEIMLRRPRDSNDA